MQATVHGCLKTTDVISMVSVMKISHGFSLLDEKGFLMRSKSPFKYLKIRTRAFSGLIDAPP
jgi:hypothetical protein